MEPDRHRLRTVCQQLFAHVENRVYDASPDYLRAHQLLERYFVFNGGGQKFLCLMEPLNPTLELLRRSELGDKPIQ